MVPTPHRGLSADTQERVCALVSEMTLQEKISQMVYDAPAIERLGIPSYNWWNEALHGVARAGLATVFPQAIGLAATWNADLVHRIAIAISDEARAKHHEAVRLGLRAIYTGLTFWSPNINIFRDPRWGRGQETYGEDPYLTSAMGVAFVKGLQGEDVRYLKVVATPKHFAVHSGPERDRHHFDAQVSTRDLRETYLAAFEACVKEGHAASVMGAYNRVDGEPCCASPTLLGKILRGEWGFDGYVVSDCGAICDIYAHHEVVETAAEAAALAVEAGCELNCGEVYPALQDAVDQGLISEEAIDQVVERLLTARFHLGMFDPPEQVTYAQIPYEMIDSPDHRQLALQAARESIVLLKNTDSLLPLSKNLDAIAVVGPNADEVSALLGNYSGTPAQATTPLGGIRHSLPATTRLYYARGCSWAEGFPSFDPIPASYMRPQDQEMGRHGLTGEYFSGPSFDGQPALRRLDPGVDFVWPGTTPLTGRWADLFAVRWTGSLIPPTSGIYELGVRGLSAYRLYLDSEILVEYQGIHRPMLNKKTVELHAGRFYDVRLEYVNRGSDPQVQLLWAPPIEDLTAQALEAARRADVIVAVMGLSPHLEGEEMPLQLDGFLGGDRTDIALPMSQQCLLKKLYAVGKPLVLVLLNGSALAIPWAAEHIPAILEAWYPGQAGGVAIADVLFGDYNPSGRLPVTFYRSVEDLPPFEDYGMEGRTYRYFQGQPLFPFGYGLSYTTFEFEELLIHPSSVEIGGTVTISADLTNTGSRAGDQVVQLYLRRPNADGSQPIKQLKGLARITLEPGQRRTVTFDLHSHQLGTSDEEMRYVVQPGTVEVMIGYSAKHLPLAGRFELVGQATDVGANKVFFSRVRSG